MTPEKAASKGSLRDLFGSKRKKIAISVGAGVIVLLTTIVLLVSYAANTGGPVKALGNCLDNAYGTRKNGNAVQMYRCDNSDTQIWTFTSDGKIKFGSTKYCLDVKDSATAARSLVTLWQCSSDTNSKTYKSQKWTVRSDKSILNVQSGLCLDVQWASTAEATPVWLWECNGTDAQKWTVPTGGSTPTPTPAPTPSPTPEPTPTPTPPPTGGTTTCPLPKYPSPSCTGVPAGTAFTKTVDGDYDATTPGMVIDKWNITGDLHIKAPNVVVKNSQIGRSVFNRYGTSTDNQKNTYAYAISDSTIGPANGCIRQAGLQEANYTATRVHIRGVDHGIDMSEPGNVVLQDSFVTLCYLDASVTPPDGSPVLAA